jgi:hypothetical protein
MDFNDLSGLFSIYGAEFTEIPAFGKHCQDKNISPGSK